MSTDNQKLEVMNKNRTLDEVREHLKKSKLEIDPDFVLAEVDKDFRSKESGNLSIEPNSIFFRALTLVEFENGVLMFTIVPEHYRTFAIDMMRQLQKEYNCTLVSEKATTELIVLTFVRVLELQRRLDGYINDPLTKIDISFFAILSKELDRANRQYSSALQTLRMLKQPSLNVNIKTNTAILGQNQVIQENQNVKPI